MIENMTIQKAREYKKASFSFLKQQTIMLNKSRVKNCDYEYNTIYHTVIKYL